jgi:hypothetical protein
MTFQFGYDHKNNRISYTVIHYVKGHMKDYTFTSSQYFILSNKRLYAKEPKGNSKPRKVFLASS